MNESVRLSRNFHQTFIPERQYLHAMMRFAASHQSGDYLEIAEATGIPTGQFSGKVPAILNYCRGMGLLRLGGNLRTKKKSPLLTPFGRIVFLEDPHLKEELTQWIAHFNLCSIISGAEIWYYTFFAGFEKLGINFSRIELGKYLSSIFAVNSQKIIGPLVRMYEDEAAFKLCGALSEVSQVITRNTAPIIDDFGFAYGAWIIQLIADHFTEKEQITITELNDKAGWRSIPGWNVEQGQQVLALLERKGVLYVDRQMAPWIVQPRLSTEEVWGKIYDDLI